MISETKRNIRRFDEDGYPLQLADHRSQGIAVRRMLGSFSDGLVFRKNGVRKNDGVPAYCIVDDLAAGTVDPRC